MSKSDKQALNNAGKIIERFGGIRPMAAKIDTPVTTVQGWKKRDVIPGTRRDQILAAASDNNIDLSDLSDGKDIANQNGQPAIETKTPVAIPTVKSGEDAPSPSTPSSSTPSTPSTTQSQSQSHAELMAAIEQSGRKTMIGSVWIATGLILLTGAVAAFLLWPGVKKSAQKIEEQSQKLTSLETEVEDVNERASFYKSIVPENIQEKMDDLQTQARNIQTTVTQLSERADEISSGVFSADAGPLSQRLAVIEQQMAEFSGVQGNFGKLVARIKNLEESIPGQEQLSGSVSELRTMVENMDTQNTSETLDQNLAEAQDEQGALGETLEGVGGNDLKAAAMLIAFSQLRDSLNREAPFENDLALLQKLAGSDNVELQDSLLRLAPHANGGVLTAQGLSGEFKGLAGDIVVSSLKGEDVSFKDKAKARLNNVFQVEKQGSLVSGTDTQVKVAKAQSLLDEGDIQGAISELQTLDGEAAQTAQPFIQQAQVSLLSEKVQQMLGETILSKISGQLPVSNMLQGMGLPDQGVGLPDGAVPTTPAPTPTPNMPQIQVPSFSMDAVKENLEGAIPTPAPEVIRDEESGVTILPTQPGFKGFSSGQ